MLNIYLIHSGKIQHRFSHTTSLCLLQPLTYTTSTNPTVFGSLMLHRFLSEISHELSLYPKAPVPPKKLRLTRIYMLILRSRRYISKLNYYLLTGDNQ